MFRKGWDLFRGSLKYGEDLGKIAQNTPCMFYSNPLAKYKALIQRLIFYASEPLAKFDGEGNEDHEKAILQIARIMERQSCK